MLSVAHSSLRARVGCRDARHLLDWTRDVLEEEQRPLTSQIHVKKHCQSV